MRWLIPLLIAASLSGCLSGNDSETAEVDSLQGNPRVLAADATGNETWWSIELGDETLTGFEFTVPESAYLQREIFDGFTIASNYLEFSWQDGAPEGDWGIFAFHESSQGAWLAGSYVQAGYEMESYSLTPIPETSTHEPSNRPAIMGLHEDLTGQALQFVVARSDGGPATLAWTAAGLSSDGAWVERHDNSAEHARDFSGTGILVPALGTGDGFHVSGLREFYGGLTRGLGMIGSTTVVGEPRIQNELPEVRPYMSAKDSVVNLHHEVEQGWSSSLSWYSSGEGAGRALQTLDLHGTTESHETIDQSAAPVGGLVMGFPIVIGHADGAGEARSDLRLEAADTNDLFLLTTELISFGATLDQLIGIPSADEALSFDGLIDTGTPGTLHLADGTLHERNW